MDDTLCAWAAGFFDGEGSINIVRQGQSGTGKSYHVLVAEVSQVDPRPLLELQEHWGGAIRAYDRAGESDKWRPFTRWTLRSAAAEKFLRDVRPYLRVKGQEVDIALAFRATFSRRGACHELTEGVLDLRNDLKRQLEEGRRS